MNTNLKRFKCNQFNSWLEINREFDLPVNLYVDDLREPIKNGINIAYICEPQVVYRNKNFFIGNKDKYDIILTFNDDILKECANSELFEFGTCWVSDKEINKNKEFSVSFLVGGKNFSEGHKMRHLVWERKDNIKIPKKFFNSSRIPYSSNEHSLKIFDDKSPLFDSQFHICIENSQENNYFSEKLIDCLYSKTIPIYWGCPNIGKWFNTESIFVVNSFEEIFNVVNNLNEQTYHKLKKSIDENHEKSLKFLDLHERLYKKIDNIVERYKINL